jgi:hypothetical protein
MTTTTVRGTVCLGMCLSLSAWAQSAPAPTPDPAPAAAPVWSAGSIEFSGLIDGYYSFNNNHPASRFNTLRNFELRANEFSLNMAKLSLTHAPSPVGFTLDLGFGRAWKVFHATDPVGTDVIQYVPQAYVSLKPENWGGFQFDFGKFYTSAGAELTENNLTWTYGRGYLYTNGPYYHFGARMTKPITESFTAGFQVLNGWNNVEDNNSGKTLGFTTAWTGKKISWYNTFLTGPEKTETNDGRRNFYDTVINLNPTSKSAFYINFDYGRENRAFDDRKADWIAIGVAGHFQTSTHTSVTARYENYNDRDGFITGRAQSLNSLTATGEYRWNQGLLSRLEYRRDYSNQPFFERGYMGTSKHQDTLTLGFVAFFGPR